MIAYGVGTLRTLRVHWTLKELNLFYTTEAIHMNLILISKNAISHHRFM